MKRYMINKRYARGRRPGNTRGMNKTEAEYAEHLKLRQISGEIQSYTYEPIKFRLADRTWYTPDFIVLDAEGYIEAHEVKGYWEDDARVKIKVFAEQFPWFKIIAVKKRAKKRGGGWEIEDFTKREKE